MVTEQNVRSRHDNQAREARAVAETVVDPELPMLSLADLGVLRSVELTASGVVVVTITPTYSGCPAMAEMRSDLEHTLRVAGFREVEIRTALHPPWTSDWITPDGRRKLADHGIAPPAEASRGSGPVPLTLLTPRTEAVCPRCGTARTERLSEFSATACKALYRCRECREPFEKVKEI